MTPDLGCDYLGGRREKIGAKLINGNEKSKRTNIVLSTWHQSRHWFPHWPFSFLFSHFAYIRSNFRTQNARLFLLFFGQELKKWRNENVTLFFIVFVLFIFRIQQAAVERKREDASREEQEQISRWSSTLSKVLDLRCDGVTDEAVWKEVGGG